MIAESTSATRVKELACHLGLDPTFSVNDIRNLVPTHRSCNSRKSNIEFNQNNLRFYFEVWATKIPRVELELERLGRQSQNEALLVKLASRIESGDLTVPEVVGFLERNSKGTRKPTTEPLVVCFGLLSEEIDDSMIPEHVPREYSLVCDFLENDLMCKLQNDIPCLSVITERSRNGETVSIRVAFWNLDLEHLERTDFGPWQVHEVAYYSEIYSDGWHDLFPKAVVSTYHAVIRDDGDSPFGIKRCPECGAQNFDYSSETDYNRDEVYFFIRCKKCGWSDWTQ